MICLSLYPEPTDSFNPKAIKVIVSVKGRGSAIIGYVSKKLTSSFNEKLKDVKMILLGLNDLTVTTTIGVNYSYVII